MTTLPGFRMDEDDQDANPGPDRSTAAMMTKFLEARTVLLFGPVDQKVSERVATQLLYLDHLSDEPIKLVINSPGGHVESGDTVHDLIAFLRSPVAVIGTGWVGSISTHIFLGAAKERRFCLPSTRFLIHQPSGGAGGKASDIAIQAQEIIKLRERIARVIAERTGQTLERVTADIDRDYWMSTDEAKAYGILGTVVTSMAEVKF